MTRQWVLVGLVFAAAACDAPPAEAPVTAVRDSAGIQIVENGPVEDLPFTRIGPEPVWRVGWSDDGPLLERLSSGALLDDGAVIADGQGALLYVIDGEGAAQTVGRRGEGPGEFQSPISVVATADGHLAVWDDALARVTRVSVDGELIDTRPFAPGRFDMGRPAGMIGDAHLGWIPSSLVMRPGDGESFWHESPLVVTDLASLTPDTAGVVPFVRLEMEGDRPNSNPFLSFGSGDVRLGGFVWATNDRTEVRWLAADGSTERIARWGQDAVRVDDALWAEYEASVRANSSSDDDPESAQRITERLRNQREDAPDQLPFFRWVVATPQGTTWLSEYTMSAEFPRRYLVVSADGHARRWIEFERPVRILDLTEDRALGIEEDAWGVQAAVVFAIDPDPASN